MLCAKYDYKMDIAVKQEEAFEDGKQQKAIEAAKNLLKMNLGSIVQISQAVGLTIEEVQKLTAEIKTAESN